MSDKNSFKLCITADQALAISLKHTKTQQEIDDETIDDIGIKIKEDAQLGGRWITLRKDWVNKAIREYFEGLGYKIEFEKGTTLMDADRWKLSW